MNYCTLFDINYLTRGIVLYESLIKQEPNCHIFLFPFDDKCYNILQKLELENATIISMKEFENEKLLSIKKTRTAAEYCWTCTPSIIEYVLNNFQVDACTYLDADLFFYRDPSLLISQIPAECSVLITPHMYTVHNAITKAAGIYCVQFMTFKNNEDGKEVLKWWRDACLEWCYNRVEEGKFGDQKYLDDWPERFKGKVWELDNPGAGVAPWNVQQYIFHKRLGTITGVQKKNRNSFDLYFYHFHSLSFQKIIWNNMVIQSIKYANDYLLPADAIKFIYKPYSKKLLLNTKKFKKLYSIPANNSIIRKTGLMYFLKTLKTHF